MDVRLQPRLFRYGATSFLRWVRTSVCTVERGSTNYFPARLRSEPRP